MSGRLLCGVLALHDVADVELFAQKVLNDYLRRRAAWLNPDKHDEMVTFLIGTAWELSTRFDPARNTSFSKYLFAILPRRVVDGYRSIIQDTRSPKPELPLSFDFELDGALRADDNGAGARLARIERALAAERGGAGDSLDTWEADRAGLLGN